MDTEEQTRADAPESEAPKKTWEQTRHGWYENLSVSVRQLDFIIWGGIALLIVVFVLIGLEAAGIFSLFG